MLRAFHVWPGRKKAIDRFQPGSSSNEIGTNISENLHVTRQLFMREDRACNQVVAIEAEQPCLPRRHMHETESSWEDQLKPNDFIACPLSRISLPDVATWRSPKRTSTQSSILPAESSATFNKQLSMKGFCVVLVCLRLEGDTNPHDASHFRD